MYLTFSLLTPQNKGLPRSDAQAAAQLTATQPCPAAGPAKQAAPYTKLAVLNAEGGSPTPQTKCVTNLTIIPGKNKNKNPILIASPKPEAMFLAFLRYPP